LFSDEPWSIWALIRREPLYLSPERTYYRSSQPIDIPESFMSAVACGDAHLAWFGLRQGWIRTPDELLEVVDLAVVSIHEDGALFRLHRTDLAEGCRAG
jgi:hypothetical protein